MGDWASRWLILKGSVLLDSLGSPDCRSDVVHLYSEALVTALDWSYRTYDATAARILWKLSDEKDASRIELAGLVMRDLSTGLTEVQIKGEPLTLVAARKRAAEAKGPSPSRDDSDLLSGWKPGLPIAQPRRKPMPWDGL
jgi:hypothetical protein